jgi:hypothetical protein
MKDNQHPVSQFFNKLASALAELWQIFNAGKVEPIFVRVPRRRRTTK